MTIPLAFKTARSQPASNKALAIPKRSCEQARRDRKETEGSEAVSGAVSAAVDARSQEERLCEQIEQAVKAGLVVPEVGKIRPGRPQCLLSFGRTEGRLRPT